MTGRRWRHGSGWLPDDLARRVGELGESIGVDAVALVTERAELMGLPLPSDVSSGGASRLLRTADDWIAVSLARPDDWDLVPAWLEVEADDGAWESVVSAVAGRPAGDVVATGALLGLPVARLGERSGPEVPSIDRIGSLDGVRVVDLSSLWAGPLAGRLLADAGADVTKVESIERPDGARRGNDEFFERLNGAKTSMTIDFAADRARLHRVVAEADVVITATRARALEQLGLVPTGHVWLSITGYGLAGDAAGRVAFGDDAAVAGGLVAWEVDEPRFVGDAIADPLTGLVGAGAVAAALAAGAPQLIDLAMSDVAASFAPGCEP